MIRAAIAKGRAQMLIEWRTVMGGKDNTTLYSLIGDCDDLIRAGQDRLREGVKTQ